ncbi:MAG: RsmE family RNA methyltransferase [Patescibacteria group bacterium]
MKIHRFFVEKDLAHLPQKGEVEIADSNLAHQLRHVLRFQVGHMLVLLDNSGYEFHAHIIELTNRSVVFEIDSVKDKKSTHDAKLRIFMSLSKRPSFEMVLEKGTELGVDIFTPVLSERSEKKSLNIERSERIVREAAEQCERATLPKITEAMTFEEMLANFAKEKNFFVLHPSGEQFDLNKILTLQKGGPVSFCIGPEGGWSPKEIEAFKNGGVSIYSLGGKSGNILRAETAAIACASLVLLGRTA